MSEIDRNKMSKPQDPELMPSQSAVKNLCEEVLRLREPNLKITYEDVVSQADPASVLSRLRMSSLGSLMLKDGDSLSADPTDEYWPELDLIVGEARLFEVGVRAWGWEYDKARFDPNGPDRPPFDVIEYPGEKDWMHQLDIRLWYSNGRTHEASQVITTQTSSMLAGSTPGFIRKVYAAAYAEMGYEGHNDATHPDATEEEVLGFVALARELFDTRVQLE